MTTELLDPGEAPIWTGQPSPLRYALSKSWHTFLFGILFFGFSVFWTLTAARQGGRMAELLDWPFWMFGIPFLVVGAAMLLSPFWHFWRALRTVYVLTAKRALIAVGGPLAQRISVPITQIRFVDVQLSGDTGTVYFKETSKSDGEGGTKTSREGFVAISEPVKVEQLLRRAIERTAPRFDRAAT